MKRIAIAIAMAFVVLAAAGGKEPSDSWALVSEPGFLKFQICKFSFLEFFLLVFMSNNIQPVILMRSHLGSQAPDLGVES